MKWEKREYNGYRGRMTVNDKLKIVAGILLALVLLLSAAILWGQRYIVYTDEGAKLELPFLDRSDREEKPLGDISVVVEP